MSKESIIVTIIGVVFLAIFAVLLWKAPDFTKPATANPALLVRPESHQTHSGGKVTLIEFGDYECPACEALYPVLKQTLDSYGSSTAVNFVFRNFPLPQHHYAEIAAEAAEAAGLQGKYFEMHDALYSSQDSWVNAADPMPVFDGFAKTIGLNVAKFDADMKTDVPKTKVAADKADAVTLSLDHTPTLYINNTEIMSITPQSLKAAIDAELAK